MTDFVRSQAEIRDAILRDQQNRVPDIATATDSDAWIRASGVANAAAGLYQHQDWIVRQLFANTCDPKFVLHHAAQHGIARHPATFSVGSITLTGTPGSVQSAASPIKAANGTTWLTSAPAVLPQAGSIAVPAQAAQAGAAGNAAPGTTATLTTTAPGINSAATVVQMIGGADQEDIEHLRQRLLDQLRRPPAGGNTHDYERWAMAVPGITAAYAYNLRRGPGTIDLLVVGQNGPPAPATIAAVRAYITAQRPAGLPDLWIAAPTIRRIDHRLAIQVASGAPADYQPTITAALATWMAKFSPGSPYIKSQAEALISSVAGITDRQLLTPATNIQPQNDANVVEWLQLGNVEVIEL